MTSVARSRIDGGTARPSALAVLRFTAISNGGKLHREIARLLAEQDAIHIGGGATKVVYRLGSVGEQTAVFDKVKCVIDRRYVVSGRRRYDRRAMRGHECIRRDDKAASRLAPKSDDGRFNLYVVMNGRSDWHDLE
jgi:hypothetical protein